MIFALGFFVAGLLALLFLPAVQRRAARLAARRLEMQLPLSMDEIVAERDQLRAEFAVERRRIEQKLEAAAETRYDWFETCNEILMRLDLWARPCEDCRLITLACRWHAEPGTRHLCLTCRRYEPQGAARQAAE